ncbi:hypothetical protein DYB25_002818 [Aphanomyces astaci]|uniref:RBR-type E3 ubiquitin transferase n=1 Tax=Aphanomyces astaci TaxID=112090 RepID=A0A397B138_APHAT|nr:hypothetical protein DYB25_002818 [Aphanomyces astaci]
MDADESYFSRLWEAESPEALLEVLLEIQSKIDAMTARDGGNVSAVCIISTLDSHERQHARLWTSTAIDIKYAIHDRVVETPATPRKLTLVKEASDPSYALNVLMRLTSFGRSMSGAGGGSAATTPGGGFHHTHHPSLEHNIIDQQPSATDSLLRSLGSLMGFVETCYCQICLEYVDVATTIALDACGHRFCIECLEGYVTSKITDGMVYPTCFFAFPPEDGGAVPSTCHAAIQATDLRALITSEDVWAKYEKFKFNKEHANARECPHCHHVQVSAAANPTISCDACRQVYCFSHSNAHPGMSCADYEKARRAEDKLNHAKISQIAKFCPGCKSPVEKSAGCAGAQMSEAATRKPSFAHKAMMFLFRLALCVIFGPPALVLTLACSALACCCVPCLISDRDSAVSAFLGCFCISGWVFMVPVVIVLALPFLPFVLVASYFWPEWMQQFWQDQNEGTEAEMDVPSVAARGRGAEADLSGPYQSV